MGSKFSELLLRARQQAGMTQEDLALRSGVSGRTIRGLETGDRTNPRVGTVQLLSDALNLSAQQAADLLASIGAEPPAPEPVVPAPRREPRASLVPERLVEAVGVLADAVAAHWTREEERQRIHDPFPLPVRWRVANGVGTDHWANVRRLPPGAASEPLALAGRLDQVAEVYRRVPSGRLVVLGKAGAGKSAFAVRLVLDLLADRADDDPVPVVFGLGSWDPATTPVRDWLADQLARDHPGLAATGPGGVPLAEMLVRSGLVLPVLDGFDEIADGLRRTALDRLNATGLPLVLTSRPAEYATLAEADALAGAAPIELTDLDLADVGDYLSRTARGRDASATAWSPVLDHLRAHPDDPASRHLAAVLTSPLTVTLARAAYGDTPGRDPAELLDTARFGAPQAIEDHLLDAYVPAVYPAETGRHWDAVRAQHWLARIAGHLDRLGTRDLAWWQLGNSLCRRARLCVMGFVITLAVAVTDGVLVALFTGSLAQGLLNAAVIGPTAGLTFALAHGFLTRSARPGCEPNRTRLRLGGGVATTRRRLVPRLLAGLVGGLVFGLVNGVGRALESDPGSWLVFTLGYALVFGLGISVVGSLVTRFEAPLETGSVVSPAELLEVDRANVLTQTLFGGLAFGAVVLVLAGIWPGLVTVPPVLFGLICWVVVALGYWLSLTAWGQWVVFARLWLPLTGRLPWSVAGFLEDACRRGVLRHRGAVYQFRHARLQDHLARHAAG